MIGIDIGSKSIKIIELNKSGQTWTLKSSGAVGYSGQTPDKIIDENEFKKIADLIKGIIKKVEIKTFEVNISLPEAVVFTRLIKFPLLSEEEVSAAVKWEAEQYIPIPASEAVIQYTILEKNDTTSQTSVLLVATPKVVVEKFVKVLQLAGLTPVVAETELTALTRSLAPQKGISLLLDIGFSSTDMAIVKDASILFTRSISVAGEAFTRAVSQSLAIEPIQAEEYKKTYGLSDNQLEGKVKRALEPIFRVIIEEIKKAIQFYRSEEKGDAPTSIILTGGASTMPGIVSYLTQNLGIETVVGDPFGKITLDEETKKNLANYASLYSAAVGLAMRDE
jgi:type IV pilus assembly protein PilM